MVKVFLFTSHFAAVLATLQLWLIIASASPANRVWIVRRDVESVTETNSQNVSWFTYTQFNWLSLAKYKILHFALFCRQQRYKTLRLEFILWKLFPTSGFVMRRQKSRPKLSILPVKLRKPLFMLFCQTQTSYLVYLCILHILFNYA